MDPDLNKYDLTHSVIRHQALSPAEMEQVFREAHHRFYTNDHMETVMRRHAALGGARRMILATRFKFYGEMAEVHNMYSYDAGLVRYKYRRSRRPGYPLEGRFRFYAKYAYSIARTYFVITREMRRAIRTSSRIWNEVREAGYEDRATSPSAENVIPTLQARPSKIQKTGNSDRPAGLGDQVING